MVEEPCAYYDRQREYCHPLYKHSLNVSRSIEYLFRDRLEVEPPAARIPGLTNRLLEAGIIAGVLHDVGKASIHYQKRVRIGRPGGFQYHEYVGALVLSEASGLLMDEMKLEESALLLLAAGAVARHHAAMKNRHPTILLGGAILGGISQGIGGERKRLADELYRAASSLDQSLVEKGVPLELLPPWAVEPVLEALEEITYLSRDAMISTLKESIPARRLAEKIIGGASNQLIKNSSRAKATSIVIGLLYRLTGSLITSDILVAGCERRPGEGPEKAYAKSWMRELMLGHDAVEACTRLVGEAFSHNPT